MMKKTMLYLLLLLSVLLLAACQKQPQPEIKLPEPQAAASPAQPESAEQTLTLGLIDFEADKELLRGLIQSYNASGAPVRIKIVNYADGAETRTPSRAARPSSWPGMSPICSTAAT